MIWTDEQIREALLVEAPSGLKCGKVQFNSKDIEKKDLFIALSGKRDGHEFVVDAIQRGAAAAIVSRYVEGVDKNKLITVDDTLEALKRLAEYKRHKSKAKFIAITGSVGKTSSKEALKLMLNSYGKTFANYGTFNNFLGVPLTLASMPDNTEYVIIEMGMSAPDELNSLSNQVTPDIAVITTISEGHLEFFDSVEKIADAKCEIFKGLDINEGTAIINRDIPTYGRCMQNIDMAGLQNIKTFGINKESDVKFVSHELLDNQLTRLQYDIQGEEIEIVMPIIPVHLAENFAAGFAVIKALKLDLDKAVSAISSFEAMPGRGKIIEVKRGDKKCKIICDYYNSNPQSLKASLTFFAELDNPNKIAILGDMGELGEKQVELHKQMVSYIKDSGVTKLFLVGDIMENLKGELPSDIEIHNYSNVEQLINKIDKFIQGGELILIKGSRSIRLEIVAKHLGVKNAL